jgi:hypothetical protein
MEDIKGYIFHIFSQLFQLLKSQGKVISCYYWHGSGSKTWLLMNMKKLSQVLIHFLPGKRSLQRKSWKCCSLFLEISSEWF